MEEIPCNLLGPALMGVMGSSLVQSRHDWPNIPAGEGRELDVRGLYNEGSIQPAVEYLGVGVREVLGVELCAPKFLLTS